MARAKTTETTPPEAAATENPAAPPEQPAWLFVAGYLADGRPARFLRGVPARDLTQAEIDTLTDDQRERAMTSGLYRPANEKVS